MKLVESVKLPLYIYTTKSKTPKSKVIFNLNNYRNMFFIKNNNAKQAMKEIILDLGIRNLGVGPFKLVYTYFHGNRRKIDVANTCSIIDKFFCDALTESDVWPDDNIDYVKDVEYKWGGIDEGEGYCKVDIFKLEEEDGYV